MGGTQHYLKLHAPVLPILLGLFFFFSAYPAAAETEILLEAECTGNSAAERQLCSGIVNSLETYFSDIHWQPAEDRKTEPHARKLHVAVSSVSITEKSITEKSIIEKGQASEIEFTAELSFYGNGELLWEESVPLAGAGASLSEAIDLALFHASQALPPLMLEVPGLLTGDRIERAEKGRVWLNLQSSAPVFGGEYYSAADRMGDEAAVFKVNSLAYWGAVSAGVKEQSAERINSDSYFSKPVDEPWYTIVPAEVIYTKMPLKAGMSVHPEDRITGFQLSSAVSYMFPRGAIVSISAEPDWLQRAVSLQTGLSAGYVEYDRSSGILPVFWAAGTAGLQLTLRPRPDVREDPARLFGFFSRGELLAGVEAGLGYAEQRNHNEPETVRNGIMLAADFSLAGRCVVNSRIRLGIEGGAFFLMDIPDSDDRMQNDLADTGFIYAGPSVTFLL